MDLKRTFGTIGKLYDSARTGYVNEVIEDVAKLGTTFLEVGCGTGKATKALAEKGCDIIGLDISQDLIDIAKQNTSHLYNVAYIKSSFEDTLLSENSFDVITSAQAWHWVDPKVAYKKANKLLKNDGYLAVLWKAQEYEKTELLSNVKKLFFRNCPDFSKKRSLGFIQDDIENSDQFNKVDKKVYRSELEFSKEDYANLVSTMSWVINMPEEYRDNFMTKLNNLLDTQPDKITVPYRYNLLTAKVKK